MAELSRDKDPNLPSDVQQPGGTRRRKPISHEMLKKLEAAGNAELKRQKKRAEEPHSAAGSPKSSAAALTLEELQKEIKNLEVKDCQDTQALLQSALDLTENAGALERLTIAWCINNLGVALEKVKCQADAETCYKHALKIGHALEAQEVPFTKPAIAAFLNNYAILQYAMNRLQDAEHGFRMALKFRQEHLLKDPSHLGQGHCNLALFLAETDLLPAEAGLPPGKTDSRLREAKTLLEEAFADPNITQHGIARPAWALGNILWRVALREKNSSAAKKLLDEATKLHKEAIQGFLKINDGASFARTVQSQLDFLE